MKKWIILALVLIPIIALADTKVVDMTADTSPTSDDLIYVVNDPSGTPADRKVTLGDAITKAHGLTGNGYYLTLNASNVIVSSALNTNLNTIAGLSPANGKIIIANSSPAWSLSAFTLAAPGTSGNILKSDGTNWTSSNSLSSVTIGGFTASKGICSDGSGNATACTNLTDTNYNAVTNVGTFASPITDNPYSLTNGYNVVLWYGATGEVDLPAAVAGMNIVIYNTGAFTITIDPNGTDVIVRDGTAQNAGVSMTLSSGAGNYVTLVSDTANHWVTLGYKGTLAQGS